MRTALVICEETDLEALWAWRWLQAAEIAPLELVTAGQLRHALRWNHSIDDRGVDFEVVLADGRVLCPRQIGGVFNRLKSLPLQATRASSHDNAYAEMEWSAFVLSWLHALDCPMLNRPAPLGLSGHELHSAGWASLALHAGLPVQPVRESWPATIEAPASAPSRIFAVAGSFIGLPDSAATWQAACQRFVQSTGCAFMSFDLIQDPMGVWRLASATTCPDPSEGGDPVMRHIGEALRS